MMIENLKIMHAVFLIVVSSEMSEHGNMLQKGMYFMLMKIGDVTNKFGVSHRALYYWENVGILKSTRGENDYRYYDEENIQKIKQIVILRKLRLSIPSIQTIFTSNELSKVIAVFSEHLDETKKEKEQLNALGLVLNQLLNMLKDRQDMDCIYHYLDTVQTIETEELKAALKTVFSNPVQEIILQEQPEPVVDMEKMDLSLELMTENEIPEVTEVVKRCYANTEDVDKLLNFYNFKRDLQMSGCRWWYKLMQKDVCIGVVNLAYTGRNSMAIRNLAYIDPDHNIYIFELLKQRYPDVLCWMMFEAEEENEYCYPDREMKKTQFREDNGFRYLTSANRRDQYEYLTKPFDQIYNGSKYRFALGLDETGDLSDLSWLRCSMANADWYDNYMGNWRITDSYMGNGLFYDNYLGEGKYFDNVMHHSEFCYSNLENSIFENSNLKNCKIENCDLAGMTINGIDVQEALKFYVDQKKV